MSVHCSFSFILSRWTIEHGRVNEGAFPHTRRWSRIR